MSELPVERDIDVDVFGERSAREGPAESFFETTARELHRVKWMQQATTLILEWKDRWGKRTERLGEGANSVYGLI